MSDKIIKKILHGENEADMFNGKSDHQYDDYLAEVFQGKKEETVRLQGTNMEHRDE